MFPNSAPDSFTPKNLNLVVAPGQRPLEGDEGAVVVPEAGREVGGSDVGGTDVGAEVGGGVVAVPGMHCE